MSDLPDPELLFDLSCASLQALQMSSLDRAARHLKAAKAEWNSAVREEAMGVLAEYFIAKREEILTRARATLDVQAALEFPSRERKRA
jgi:hypothetical protein